MIGLLQRVARAEVVVGRDCVGRIAGGLLVFVCAERGDGETESDRLLERLLGYRVFSDAQGRMNLSVREVGGGLLLVPQFTLAADTSAGLRPSFSRAAPPDAGARLFEALVAAVAATGVPHARGRFGADMQVTLTNDGPVTFWLQV